MSVHFLHTYIIPDRPTLGGEGLGGTEEERLDGVGLDIILVFHSSCGKLYSIQQLPVNHLTTFMSHFQHIYTFS